VLLLRDLIVLANASVGLFCGLPFALWFDLLLVVIIVLC